MKILKVTEPEINQLSKEFAEKFSDKLRKSGVSNYWEHEDRVYQMLKSFLTKRLDVVDCHHEYQTHFK